MKYYLFFIVITALLVLSSCQQTSPETIAFAKCLTEKEAKMFGAYWCPHCQRQKKMLDGAFKEITYIECSLPGGQGQTEICQQAGIESYPTWEFANGERRTGELSFEQLATQTGCIAP